MRTLKPTTEEFDKLYWDSLRIYKGIRNKIDFHKNEAYLYLDTHTREAAKIKFIGVIDTVKAFNDGGLYDISQTPNIAHVRHALAILEDRNAFSPEKYSDLEKSSGANLPNQGALSDWQKRDTQTCIEAWFLGTHGDVGGSAIQDGWSLWPLQFLLSEAEASGLCLKFQPLRGAIQIQNPLDYAMPSQMDVTDDTETIQMPQSVPYKNGYSIRMWDLADVFNIPGFKLSESIAKSFLPTGERPITGLNDGSGNTNNGVVTVIHPSVHYHDDCTPLGILYINYLAVRSRIRADSKNITISWGELFWNRSFRQKVDLTLRNPRVLVCGVQGSAKSTLINVVSNNKQILTDAKAVVNNSQTPTPHDIETELLSTHTGFRFHDSRGWDSGTNDQFLLVKEFLKTRRSKVEFSEQLHCVWFCIEASQSRVNSVDRNLLKELDPEGVTIILVFTKCDKLFGECQEAAITEYEEENGCVGSLDAYSIPSELGPEIARRREIIYNIRKSTLIHEVKAILEVGPEVEAIFVSRNRRDTEQVTKLVALTRASRNSRVLRRIHNQAIKAHIDEVLPMACKEAAKFKSLRSEYPFMFVVDPTRVVSIEDGRRIRAKAESSLPKLFGLQIVEDARFDDLADIFATVNSRRNRAVEDFLASSSLKSLTLTIRRAVAQSFLESVQGLDPVVAAAVEIGSTGIGTALDFYRYKALLIELCLQILVYDRMVWFGSRQITKDTAARAWIRALQSAPDIEEILQKDLIRFMWADWELLLLKIVQKLKFVADEDDICVVRGEQNA
ncbi:hypothetical protein TWF730_006293 [Orbilia blumenaviensis]|uniref:T6SS Phospholipase effector Tle1-like catalytic domain-containing protein n=1 Tax=Orbilia blumenaviensis TaxID=1796055 RepID=A0AAV9VDW0_9PEZI